MLGNLSPGSIGSTSASMLAQARSGDIQAWSKLVQLYGPLIYHWCRQKELSPEDAADVTQDVFQSVVRGLPSFDHQSAGSSFRGWLRVITGHRILDFFRRRRDRPAQRGGTTALQQLQQVPQEESASANDLVEDSPAAERLHAALAQVRDAVEERTWTAFWATTLEQRPAAEVALALGVSRQVVFAAKSRVMQMLRKILAADPGPEANPR